MKAMILAAGLGTRLRPLTSVIPKPLLPVGGVSLIEWNLLLLRANGIRNVILNLHYLGHLIEEAIGDGVHLDMKVSYSYEEHILGTGGGIKAAAWFFDEEPFIVINGDTLIEMDIRALINFHEMRQGVATLVLRDDPYAVKWGVVESDDQHRIQRINGLGVAHARTMNIVGQRMFAGVHILHPSILRESPKDTEFSIIDCYTSELARGSVLYGFVHEGYWSDIGTVERYAQAQVDVQQGLLSLSPRMAEA